MPGPAIERLEGRGVDDARPAGDRLEPPAPFAVEAGAVTRSRKRESGRASRLSTRASSRSSPSRARAERVVAAAGQVGAAGPKRQLREERRSSRPDRGGSPRRSAAWRGRRRGARPAVGADRSVAAAAGSPSRRSRQPSSAADRVPDRLHLEEGGDPFGTFGGGVVEPVEAGLGDRGRAAQEALDVVGGERLDLRPQVVGDAPRVERVDVDVRRRGPARAPPCSPVRTLTTPPGTSDVARTSVSVTAGSGRRLGGDQHDGVAGDERRREPATRARAATTSRARPRRRRRSARGS